VIEIWTGFEAMVAENDATSSGHPERNGFVGHVEGSGEPITTGPDKGYA
jgi:hypothetical protein